MTSQNKQNRLWTKDFTIIQLGSMVSIFGNALAGFATSLLVLDYTQSTLYYAIYIALFNLPMIFAPLISGAILDRFSRKRTIYTLDFISAGIYAFIAFIIYKGWFSFGILAVYTFLLGTIEGVYHVAYESFYPMLISEGNFTKAYAFSSFIETIVAVVFPISTFLYNLIGIAPLLAINALTFFIAAVMETRIEKEEDYVELQKKKLESSGKNSSRLKILLTDMKEGFQYLYSEKGLFAVACYFGFSALFGGAQQVALLPYFKDTYDNGEYVYTMVMGAGIIARAVGGAFHYNFKLPVKRKFAIALAVYLSIDLITGTYLFAPVPIMLIMCSIEGLLGITSYTIRVSATQSYVPHEKKGRFNGAFNMLSTVGSLVGEISAGALALYIPIRVVMLLFGAVTFVAALVFIGGNRKHIAPIYNRQE